MTGIVDLSMLVEHGKRCHGNLEREKALYILNRVLIDGQELIEMFYDPNGLLSLFNYSLLP